jgi:tRNA pseudouridine55 synthase
MANHNSMYLPHEPTSGLLTPTSRGLSAGSRTPFTSPTSLDGIILLNKPQDLSSQHAAHRVKRILQHHKAGHTGSLDPLATGMLPICLGDATKLSHYLLNADKCYVATGMLGIKTDTGDRLGQIIEQHTMHCTEEAFLAALETYKGHIQQIPPMFSALKHQGKPLYVLARQGIEIERAPRDVHIRTLECITFNPPYFTIRVVCSKGTYIRSLIADIGDSLDLGAHMTELHRIYTAPFEDQSMVTLEALNNAPDPSIYLLPADSMVTHLPIVSLSEENVLALYQGKTLPYTCAEDSEVRLYNPAGSFFGIGTLDSTSQILRAKRLYKNTNC